MPAIDGSYWGFIAGEPIRRSGGVWQAYNGTSWVAFGSTPTFVQCDQLAG